MKSVVICSFVIALLAGCSQTTSNTTTSVYAKEPAQPIVPARGFVRNAGHQ
jgi:type IV pilus biogenesis protein CpaD/CtpE